MRNHIYSIIALFTLFISPPLLAQDSTVQIVNRGNYYEVTMNYSAGISHYDMGVLLMQKILEEKPDFEQLYDSYIAELVENQSNYTLLLGRIADIIPQIPQEYQDEIDGMASQLSGGTVNERGDNKFSKDELYGMQLIADVFRSTQCSGISVYGAQSETAAPLTARILDWYDGANNQLAQVQSVTTIRNSNKSICTIGYLGFMGVITGFNDNGVFAGILDSPTGGVYSSMSKNSYTIDLRYALENTSTLTEAAEYVTSSSRRYSFNHLILLSDSQTSKVLENNFSGTGSNIHRALRSDTSALNPGITWGYSHAVAAVNSFLLQGSHDNHTGYSYNTNRWNSLKTQLGNSGASTTWDELKLIASFDNGDGPGSQTSGDIYNSSTQQIVLFQPATFQLEIAFKPKTGVLPDDPLFENIPTNTLTSASDGHSIEPKTFLLEQNYPNPFNPKTVIRYTIEVKSTVHLNIYDVLGREVAALIHETKLPGTYQTEWDAQNFPSGIYFCRLRIHERNGAPDGAYSQTNKIVLLR